MIGNIDRRSPSLMELLRRARLAEQARRGETAPTTKQDTVPTRPEIVDPRDERGTPYPGDFPNDLAHLYRGCF